MQTLALVGLMIEAQREMTQIIPRTFYYPAALISIYIFFTHYYTKGPFSDHWLVTSIKRGDDALQLNPYPTLSLTIFFEKSWEEADRCS